MSRPYEKPKVSKVNVSSNVARKIVTVQIDAQIVRMFTRKGFIDVFWEELVDQRKVNPKVSEKKVFDDLNEKFYKVFNEFRYSSYDSFRQRLNK